MKLKNKMKFATRTSLDENQKNKMKLFSYQVH